MISPLLSQQRVHKVNNRADAAVTEQCHVSAPGLKNRSCSVSSPEVIKGVQDQGVACFVRYDSFCVYMFPMYVLFCFLVFGCQYQRNRLPTKTRLSTYYVSSGMLTLSLHRAEKRLRLPSKIPVRPKKLACRYLIYSRKDEISAWKFPKNCYK